MSKTPLPELEAYARGLACLAGERTPIDVGFVILLFNYGEGAHLTHITSAERSTMIEMLKECVGMLESGQTPSAPVASDMPPQKYEM